MYSLRSKRPTALARSHCFCFVWFQILKWHLDCGDKREILRCKCTWMPRWFWTNPRYASVSLPAASHNHPAVTKDRKLLTTNFKKEKNHFFFFLLLKDSKVCVCFSFSCWPLARRRFSSTVSVQWPTGLTYRKIKTHWKANYRLMILGCCELFQIHCRCVSKPLCIVLTIQFHQHLWPTIAKCCDNPGETESLPITAL